MGSKTFRGYIGSPPQVRGKPSVSPHLVLVYRITPAGAGKTTSIIRSHSDIRDHPRRCGENLQIQDSKTKGIGSPPQVRGKPLIKFCHNQCIRITPAGAGKTSVCVICNIFARDHPRRCGENRSLLFQSRQHTGSPPQVRGKLCRRINYWQVHRITPAGAGKTPT